MKIIIMIDFKCYFSSGELANLGRWLLLSVRSMGRFSAGTETLRLYSWLELSRPIFFFLKIEKKKKNDYSK